MVNRIIWTKRDDHYLTKYVKENRVNNTINWTKVEERMIMAYQSGLINIKLTSKQCSKRWHNYLRPAQYNWPKTEDEKLLNLVKRFGHNWNLIVPLLTRPYEEVFERYTFLYKKKLRLLLNDINHIKGKRRIHKIPKYLFIRLILKFPYLELTREKITFMQNSSNTISIVKDSFMI